MAKRKKNTPIGYISLPVAVVNDLMEWIYGNRGGREGNPYCVPEVKDMLKAIAKERGLDESQYLNATNHWI